MNYEAIYITHLPSFYKVNIFNEISKNHRILVIYIGKHSIQRNSDFVDRNMEFDYLFLQECEFEKINKIKSIYKLIFILKNINFKKIIVGGWDLPHFWIALIFSKYFKQHTQKATIIESSIIESKLTTLKLYIKRIFLSLNDSIICAGGGVHKDVITKINKNKKIFIANGVGIPNLFYTNNNQDYNPKKGYFLYIGRISDEKNIDLLIKAFENSNFYLNIIGGRLKQNCNNIHYLDYIDNQSLHTIIKDHIALILPSKSEPWGLVIDEALICGVGVIASSNVGSANELIAPYQSGIIFENNNIDELNNAIKLMNENYITFHKNALKIDFKERYKKMKKAYLLYE